jgi:predicted Zn finger-like uncharacterized protein
MEVTCKKCHATINVPDKKIPKNQAVKVSCPKCRAKITIDNRQSSRSETSNLSSFNESWEENSRTGENENREPIEQEAYDYEDYSEDETIEFFEEGAKLALVLAADDDQAEKVKKAVGDLGYRSIIPENTRDALGKMRFHNFDLIFLCQGFDGQELRHSPILNYLNNMSMPARRLIFLALMSEEYKTMDNIMAYSVSANAVINTKDLQKLTPILRKGISEYNKFYKIYLETLVKVGKA